jgi:hypothetical protein
LVAAVAFGLLAMGCQSGGVGDPCTPEDEYQTGFSGFSEQEVNIENRSFQCTTRVCLVNHFRGRVSCPYGQTQATATTNATKNQARQPVTAADACRVPGTTIGIDVPVDPQIGGQVKFDGRQAADTVYCSCRCAGPDKNAKYCTCPSGYHCPGTYLVDDIGLGNSELAGSYCVRDGTDYHPAGGTGPDCAEGSAPGAPDYCGNKGVNP